MMPPKEKGERLRRAMQAAQYDSIVELLRDVRHLLDLPDCHGDYDTLDAYAEQEYLIDIGKQKEYPIWPPTKSPSTEIISKRKSSRSALQRSRKHSTKRKTNNQKSNGKTYISTTSDTLKSTSKE